MRDRQSLLVVDRDSAMRERLSSLFREQAYSVSETGTTDEALELIRDTEFDVVFSDVSMPDRTSAETVGALREIRPDTPIVLMTSVGDLDSSIEAMRSGALDCITKPFEPETVLLTLERALEQRALVEENRRLRRAVDRTSRLGDLIGESPAMREIFALIRRVAHSRSSVLITGESGANKEAVARAIHYHGNRADKPFVPLNCAALPEGPLESELFGHVRGAFAEAHASKRGILERASGGTLFLNEIGDMPLPLQSKLLRVLQDREIRPAGAIRAIPVDTRIIAASDRDLRDALTTGEFRRDLYYRLNVIPIRIPPLRERPEDIPHLVRAFVERHYEGKPRAVSPAAMQRLMAGDWNGNSRELENTIERAVVLSDTPELQLEDLPVALRGEPDSQRFVQALVHSAVQDRMSLRQLGDLYINEILKLTGGNKVQAAKILRVDRKTLYRRAERANHDSTAEGDR
jgi:two-component system response regulator AtoC